VEDVLQVCESRAVADCTKFYYTPLMDNDPASVIAPEVISQKRIQKSEQARVESFIFRYNVYWTYGLMLERLKPPEHDKPVSSLREYREKGDQ
jgi:hypothetical protein